MPLWANPSVPNVKDGWYDPNDPDQRLQSTLLSHIPHGLRYGPEYVRPCARPDEHTSAMRGQSRASSPDSETVFDPDKRPEWDPKKSYAENNDILLKWMEGPDTEDPYRKTWYSINTKIRDMKAGPSGTDTEAYGIHPKFPLPGSTSMVTAATPLRPRFFGPSGITARPPDPVVTHHLGGGALGLTGSGFATIRDDPAWKSTRDSYFPKNMPGATMYSAREAIREAARKTSQTGAPTSDLASLFQATATLNTTHTGPGTYRSKRNKLYYDLRDAWTDEQYRATNTTGREQALHESAAASLLHATNVVYSQRE